MQPDNLPENTRVEQTLDGSGQPDSSSARTVKEQHAPDEHREIASFSIYNEFNRAINEEDIDFNIPGVPHSAVKQLHGVSVRNLKQKIENHPNRHALQRDLQQSQSFNPFNQESKEMIHEVGNVVLCELTARYGTQSPVQSVSIILGRRHRLLLVRALLHGSSLDSYEYFVANSLVKWTNWRTKDHTHHITAEEIGVCCNNWWLRSNTVRYDASQTSS